MTRKISRSLVGAVCATMCGVAVFATIQFRLAAKDTNPPPQLNVQNTPVNREKVGVTSYASVIKKAAPSVVNIYSTRTVRMRRMPMSPFGNDPMFRQFFGEPDSPDSPDQQPQQPNRRGNRPPGNDRTMKEQSLGSGVIISTDGYILTANHVVEGADPDGVKVAYASGGKQYTAKIVGTDPPTDVAVLKIDATDASAVAIADSDKLEVGDVVLAIGNPFGIGQTVTMGIVSALGRTSLGIIPEGYENFIQTDAAINQGNSGGALIDAEGRLVGINTAIFSPSGGNAGVGFAVPANLARSVMERLVQYGKVSRGYLGVNIQSVSSDLQEQFNLPDLNGAIVTDVRPGTPASKAGLQNYDVIRELNGKKVEDSRQLRLAISQNAPGAKVTLKVLRGDPGHKPTEKTVTATLGTLHTEDLASSGNNRQMGHSDEESTSGKDALDGVEVTDVDSGARRQMNVPTNITGALVTNVDPESNSADAGLHQGDVILEIDRHTVKSADDAVELAKKATGNRVGLRVWREGGSILLSVDNSKKEKQEKQG